MANLQELQVEGIEAKSYFLDVMRVKNADCDGSLLINRWTHS